MEARNLIKTYYFKGNQEIQSRISELYISEQEFCGMMTFQNVTGCF